MSSPFVAEIKMFAGNFAPIGYATTDGQLLPISQNTALFSLLGTMYGGDGKSTFALPNLQGSIPLQQGQGSGLQTWFQGEVQGSDFVTLIQSEMPVHTHNMRAKATAVGGTPTAANDVPSLGAWVSGTQFGVIQQYSVNAPNAQMAPTALSLQGGSLPHNNLMPYLAVTYMIALQGVFPARP
jgi:microcystin-dependent protein